MGVGALDRVECCEKDLYNLVLGHRVYGANSSHILSILVLPALSDSGYNVQVDTWHSSKSTCSSITKVNIFQPA
jgi:hypothetical protein